MNLDIGLSSCGKPLGEELFIRYQNAGLRHMEISVGLETCYALPYANIKRWAKEYGVTLWSYHLPFAPFSEIDPSKKELQKNTLDTFYSLMEKAAKIGIKTFIVHASGEPIDEKERAARTACAKESLYCLAEKAKELNCVVAVEDLPRTCLGRNSQEVLDLVSAHENLKVCFDTNHLLDEDPVEFVKKVGNKIVTLHVSDYDNVNERHWLPGEGCIDWQGVLRALKEIGYQGPWLYEIGFECPRSIIRDRALCCEDFVENAKALFAEKTPPRFSDAIPNLGMWP